MTDDLIARLKQASAHTLTPQETVYLLHEASETLAERDRQLAEAERETALAWSRCEVRRRAAMTYGARVAVLEAALSRIQHELSIPAAEYVPVIGDVFLIILEALSAPAVPREDAP